MRHTILTILLMLFLSGCCATKKNASQSLLEANVVTVDQQQTDVQMSKTDSSNTETIEIIYTETMSVDSVNVPITTRTWNIKKERRTNIIKVDSSTVESIHSELSEHIEEQSQQTERTQNTAPIWLFIVALLMVIVVVFFILRRR